MWRVVYNGHKGAYALKFQVVETPDDMVLHALGLLPGEDVMLLCGEQLKLAINFRKLCSTSNDGDHYTEMRRTLVQTK